MVNNLKVPLRDLEPIDTPEDWLAMHHHGYDPQTTPVDTMMDNEAMGYDVGFAMMRDDYGS